MATLTAYAQRNMGLAIWPRQSPLSRRASHSPPSWTRIAPKRAGKPSSANAPTGASTRMDDLHGRWRTSRTVARCFAYHSRTVSAAPGRGERAVRFLILTAWMGLITFWSGQATLPIDQPVVANVFHNWQHRVAHLLVF